MGTATVTPGIAYPRSLTAHAAEHAEMGGVDVGAFGASPDASAAVNSFALQTALNLGGKVTFQKPGVYLLTSDSGVVYSNTEIAIGAGVVLKKQSGANTSFFQNAAYTRSRSSITSFTSSGLVGTIGWVSHGKSVGESVWVSGATANGYNGVFVVTGVVNADTLTVALPFSPKLGTATGDMTACAADENISFSGHGAMDWNYLNQPALTGSSSVAVMANIMSGVRNLTIRDVTVGGCQKYAWLIGACSKLFGENIHYDNVYAGADGLHAQGPLFHARIDGIYGRTGDDAMACTIGDKPQWEISRGDFYDCIFKNIFVDSAKSVGKLCGGKGVFMFDEIAYENLGGTCVNSVVYLGDDIITDPVSLSNTMLGSIHIKNLHTINTGVHQHGVYVYIPGPGYPTTPPTGSLERLEIDGLSWDNVTGHGVLLHSVNTNLVKVKNVSGDVVASGKTSGYAIVYAFNPFTHKKIEISADVAIGAHWGFAVDQYSASPVILDLTVSGKFKGNSASNSAVVWHSKGTITRLSMENLVSLGVDRVYRQQSDAIGNIDVVLSNVFADAPARFSEFYVNTTVTLNGVRLTNLSNTPFRAYSGTVRIEGTLQSSGSATKDYELASGTPTVYLRGNLRAPGGNITGAAGDSFYNTDSAWAGGSGTSKIGYYGHTGSAWTKLFGPA
jgi:hypothetical protein